MLDRQELIRTDSSTFLFSLQQVKKKLHGHYAFSPYPLVGSQGKLVFQEDAQLIVPTDPRYARLETNLGNRQAKEAIAPHTITPAVSPRGLPTRIRLSSLLRLNLDLPLKATWFRSAAVQFCHAQHHSKRRRRWEGVKGNTRNGRHNLKCPPDRRLRMVLEGTRAHSEGATCASWMAADEAVSCTLAFLTMTVSATTRLPRAS
ncbi:uncharacterized protein TNCV_4139671 [Trichonephila clavipes]|nr:uncharacterized protein TNCV_4139671 [Trichonephila clavipes]